jgi:cysteine desulfurase
LPNNINISIKGVEGESLVLMLDREGVFVSTGSACASSDLEPSHVISAIAVSPELSHSNIRLSMGRGTTKTEIDRVLKILPKAVAKLRAISSIK